MSIFIDRSFLLRVSPKLKLFTNKKTDLYNFRCPFCGDSKKNKTIISLVIEENPFQWASNELKKICEFQSKMFVDISSVVSLNWENDSNVTNEMICQKAMYKPKLTLLTGREQARVCPESTSFWAIMTRIRCVKLERLNINNLL